MSLIRDTNGTYRLKRSTRATEADILDVAEAILRQRVERLGTLTNPADARSFLRMRLGGLVAERSRRAQRMTLDLIIGPGDDGGAVIPVLVQGED